MEYEMDPTFKTPMMSGSMMDDDMMTPTPMMNTPPMMMNTPPMMMNPMDTYSQQPEVLNISAPKIRLVLPFASFDRSTPTKFAGSILNWTALIACFLWVFFLGKYGFRAGRTMGVYIIAVIFTIATTALLSSSGYQSM